MKKNPQQKKKGSSAPLLPDKQRRMLLLIANTVFFACMYFTLNLLLPPFVMPLLYTLGGGGLAIWYVIYNRGFRTRHKTADMLPDDLPLDEREAIIADDALRFSKTRWVLLVLPPLSFTLILDMAYLFLIPEGWL